MFSLLIANISSLVLQIFINCMKCILIRILVLCGYMGNHILSWITCVLHICVVNYSGPLSVLKSNWVELYLHRFINLCKMLFIEDFVITSWWNSLFEVNGIILQFILCICSFLHLGTKGSWVLVQIPTTLVNPSH